MGFKSALETFLNLRESFEFKEFTDCLAATGYSLQGTNQNSTEYHNGLRYLYVVPDKKFPDSWKVKKKSKYAVEVSFEPSDDLAAHVNKFYNTARQAAQNINREFCATEPTFAAGGALVIYFGLKPLKQTKE